MQMQNVGLVELARRASHERGGDLGFADAREDRGPQNADGARAFLSGKIRVVLVRENRDRVTAVRKTDGQPLDGDR
jgi:hypothetical protein